MSRHSTLDPAIYDRASAALLALLVVVILLTFQDYGITWDEPLQDEYGDLVVDYTRSQFAGDTDERALSFRNLYLYGGAFDALVSLLQRISPLPRFETRHLITAVIGALGLLGCHRLTRLLAGAEAAFWATVLLAITPRFYGHMFNNPKDIPFAVGYVWAVFLLVGATRRLPKISPRRAMIMGLVIGLTMGVRVGGLILLVYWGAILMAFGIVSLVDYERRRKLRATATALTASLLKVAIPAYLVMLAVWPWAQQAPLRNPLQALRHSGRFRWNRPVLFDGAEIRARDLPASYYTHYFTIALPEIVLVLLPLTVVAGLVIVARSRRAPIASTGSGFAVVGVAAFYPLIHVALSGAVVYDGIRHMLFVLPLVACLCGATLAWSIGTLGSWSVRLRTLSMLAIGLYLAYQTSVMIRLHPYQTVYFNHFAGGLRGAEGRYETDYWGNSYREAALKLEQFLESWKRRDPERIFYAKSCSTRLSSAYYFPEYVRPTGSDWRADFYIATKRWRCDERLDGRIIATVERFDVPLAVVKDRRALKKRVRSEQ